MTHTVKEIFYTLQGEGGQAGRAAVFCQFAGCNLWTGREEDRSKAICQFCDTDFVGTDGPGGGKFATADDLAAAVAAQWPAGSGGRPLVVCTGGEPLLQLDEPAINALHAKGFEIAVETNGTQPAPLDVYGLSKWRGEQALLEVHSQATVIRSSWVVGAHGRNFAKTMLRLALRTRSVASGL